MTKSKKTPEENNTIYHTLCGNDNYNNSSSSSNRDVTVSITEEEEKQKHNFDKSLNQSLSTDKTTSTYTDIDDETVVPKKFLRLIIINSRYH